MPSERQHPTIIPDTVPASLGPLAGFTGKFRGAGFNTIFRPQNFALSPTPLDKPAHGPNDNVLELNLTEETLDFSTPLGDIPNRGFVQGDISLNGIPYVQKINDVNDPDNPVGIHFEPGVWLSVPATTNPAEAATVVRMASIPHGTTIDAEGTATQVNGRPTFQPVDITPFPIGSPQNRLTNTFPSQQANDNATFRLPQDLSPFIAAGTITQAMLDNPNSILQNRVNSQNITSTTIITVDTTRPAPDNPSDPLFGGGTANIAFLQGDPQAAKPNANAVEMTATFCIETVVEKISVPPLAANTPTTVQGSAAAGQPVATFSVRSTTAVNEPTEVSVTYTQIQYSQTVLLNFNGLSWPHVSVATLIPNDAIPVVVGNPDLLTTYTVVAGDTLSGISSQFYGDATHVATLAAVNDIANPNLINVGQVLIIPDLSRAYTVAAGDTLSSISTHFYGNAGRVAMLAAVNAIANPNLIHVGQLLIVPDVSHTHTVSAGETLFNIAQQFYGNGSLFRFIAKVNGISDANAIGVGQVLIIPSV
ncbi:heme-binding protein [Mycobacterium paraterrae]|uniref:Heme-binding protein n=1 Tax=Mycobacterium paraterrae TaxID=577492 RepID=A0ABY3W052_9MYCO|nr:heme-binding protein [Mycobacterium paraterrae]UMB72503.2 heme-binding protein [Mycobacterium paraterrae]